MWTQSERPAARAEGPARPRRHALAAIARGAALAALAFALRAGAESTRIETLGFDVPATARGTAIRVAGAPQLQARLLAAPEVAADGSRRVGVLFELAPGWHIYARDPGESGVATALHFEASGAEFADLPWPEPGVFRESDGLFTTYGYAGRVLLGAELIPQSGAEPPARLMLRAEFLACRAECVPGSLELSRDLRRAQAPREAEFARALLQALPGPALATA